MRASLIPMNANLVFGTCRSGFGGDGAMALGLTHCWGDSLSLGWLSHGSGAGKDDFPSLDTLLSGLYPTVIGVQMSLRELVTINSASFL